MTRVILFDLDGTLVDTLPDLTSSLNRTLHSAGLQPFATGEVAAMIGDGMRVLITRALAARGRPFDAALLEKFHADYFGNATVASRPYPETAETLASLAAANWRMAVATNKPEAAARKLLEACNLARFFFAVGGGDSFPVRKPDPGHLLRTAGFPAGAVPTPAVMVGDHANDIIAARAADFTPVFALWGYGRPEMANGADSIPRINDLPKLLQTLTEPAPAPPA